MYENQWHSRNLFVWEIPLGQQSFQFLIQISSFCYKEYATDDHLANSTSRLIS